MEHVCCDDVLNLAGDYVGRISLNELRKYLDRENATIKLLETTDSGKWIFQVTLHLSWGCIHYIYDYMPHTNITFSDWLEQNRNA